MLFCSGNNWISLRWLHIIDISYPLYSIHRILSGGILPSKLFPWFEQPFAICNFFCKWITYCCCNGDVIASYWTTVMENHVYLPESYCHNYVFVRFPSVYEAKTNVVDVTWFCWAHCESLIRNLCHSSVMVLVSHQIKNNPFYDTPPCGYSNHNASCLYTISVFSVSHGSSSFLKKDRMLKRLLTSIEYILCCFILTECNCLLYSSLWK